MFRDITHDHHHIATTLTPAIVAAGWTAANHWHVLGIPGGEPRPLRWEIWPPHMPGWYAGIDTGEQDGRMGFLVTLYGPPRRGRGGFAPTSEPTWCPDADAVIRHLRPALTG